MNRELKFAALLIGLSFAEVAVTILFTKWLGAALTYSLFAVPTAIGLFLHWRRWQKVRVDWEVMQAILKDAKKKITDDANAEFGKRMKRLQWFWISVALLLVPGFVSDVIAFGIFFRERLYGDED